MMSIYNLEFSSPYSAASRIFLLVFLSFPLPSSLSLSVFYLTLSFILSHRIVDIFLMHKLKGL